MKITTLHWNSERGWNRLPRDLDEQVSLILYFGAVAALEQVDAPWRQLRTAWPGAVCLGCSTAGEIHDNLVSDDGVCAVLVHLDSTRVRATSARVLSAADSHAAGVALGRELTAPGLRHVFLLSDGLGVNGTALTTGLRETLPAGVVATGGLAGDGARFQRTLVGLGDTLASGLVAAVGFYGSKLQVAYGSAGGWQPFGPKRLVTRSEGNVLFTLDDQPALELYKRYLGDLAAGLPSTGLLFPLELLPDQAAETGVVRTILAIDESHQSLTFAGDMPTGQFTRLMKAGADALVGGADTAAQQASTQPARAQRLALLVSCVGRKLVMGQRVEEEVEAVLGRLGSGINAVGFYSYGEICPTGVINGCDLHNQTMTLTILSEDA